MSGMHPADRSHALLERLANLLRQELRRAGAEYGLQPVQLDALHYLSVCNRLSNTPQGVAEYLGLTKGTVSQSLKVLEARGLISRAPDPDDGRLVHLSLTPAGDQALAQTVPVASLRAAVAGWPDTERKRVEHSLETLLARLQSGHGRRSFGVCRSCRFHRVISPELARCELIGADLSPEDAGRICREHQAAA
jgi:DNA-binding MarR family transcriptional regulator